MEYKRIKPYKELLATTSTPDVFEVVFGGRYEICMIAGVEDGRLICYAVFSHMPVSNRDVYLEYLFTVRDKREQGVCTELLKYCEKYLKERGVSVILTRVFLRPGVAEDYNTFLTGRGFIPLNVTGRLLNYRLRDMMDAGTIQTILRAKNKLPEVMDYKGAGEKRINALLADRNRTGFFFAKQECDETISRFFVENDEIHGAIIASRPSADTLYISALYMDRIAEKRNMFLSLFCECLEPVLSDIDEEDIKVIIMLESETVYKGLMMVFIPPDEEYLVLEHMNLIGVERGRAYGS